MNSWKPVSEFVNYVAKGITPKYVDESSVVVINQRCIRNNIIDFSLIQYTDDTRNISEEKYLKVGDILVNSTGTGTAGRCAFVSELPGDKKYIVDSHVLVLRCDSYEIARCLSYILFSFEKTLMSFVTGSSGQSELDKIILLSLLTRMTVDSETLLKSSELISNLENKILINNKINKKLEFISSNTFDLWFTQFDFPDVSGKPYRSSGGQMKFDEKLRMNIPAHWDGGLVQDICTVNPKLSLPKGVESSYIDMNALPVSGFMTKRVKKKECTGGAKFQNNDVVVARITPCLENGKTALISLLDDDEVGFGSTEFIVIRGKKKPLYCFIACLARSERFRKYAIKNMLGTSGRKRVEPSVIRTFGLPKPCGATIELFEEKMEPLFDRMTANTKENESLVKFRDTFIPKILDGNIHLK
ncbi:MAG: type I restriction enzyme S subunit [Cocleimonas sp.]|jgi:type I restriction enzyme S subunit